MRRRIYLKGLISILVLLVVVSCTKEELSLSGIRNQSRRLTIEATQEVDSVQTKSVLQENGDVYWSPGDEISLFFMSGEKGGYKFTSQNKEVAKAAQFTGVISGITGGGEDIADDAYFYGIYPYKEVNECVNGALITSLDSEQQAIAGTFAEDLFITVSRSQNVKMGFRNVCGGVKFSVSQTGIRSVVFKGNNGEQLAGKIKVGFGDDNLPVVKEILDGEKEIILNAPNNTEFEVGKIYCIVALPTTFESGFSMKFNKTDGTSATYVRNAGVTIKRSKFGVLKNIDSGLAFVQDSDNQNGIPGGGMSTETGIYLGIIGFTTGLYPYPINMLTQESVKGYNSFIDGLSMLTSTWLYYAVDNSVSMLQDYTYPDNLYDVSILTFTDGYDEGSLDVQDEYISTQEYADAIQDRFKNETVSGKTISAYSIGLYSNYQTTNQATFKTHLNNLASSSENAFLVNDMDEVNEIFQDIADKLSETEYLQKLTFTMNSPNPGTLFRFTCDGIHPASSKKYIEATFNRDGSNRVLNNISYKGLTCKSGVASIVGVREPDYKYSYTFEELKTDDGKLIDTSLVAIWRYQDGGWTDPDAETGKVKDHDIEKIKRSIAIILNLDCSSSLGTSFPQLKEVAKSFMETLLENAIDPNEVASISLNKTSITLGKGETETLKATVLPTTALKRDVEWSSTNASVATVDQYGVVRAVGNGSATIIAKTVDGGYTVECNVSVITLSEEILLSSSELELYNGENATLVATVLPEETNDKSVTWSSSNTSVATVDGNGKVTAVAAGEAVITATPKDGTGIKATCTVLVKQHVTSVRLSSNAISTYTGESNKLSVTVLPSNAYNKSFSVESSDKSVVTVSQSSGSVDIKALGPGSATVTVTTEDGEYTAKCDVTVKQFMNGIELGSSMETMYVNDSKQLSAIITPTNATNKFLVWSSSNPEIVSVDQNGLVTALAPGSAKISASSQDGSGIVAYCDIVVKQHVSSISISEESIDAYVGQPVILSVTILPSNATNKNFSVESSDESIATVAKSGQNITLQPLGIGNTTITVTSEDGEYTAECDVVVRQYVESISLNKTTGSIYVGESMQLTATIAPANASDKTIKWESSNSNIATVDQNGSVTAVSPGTVTITARVQDGSGVVATCNVTVKQHVSSISLSSSSINLELGRSATITASIMPANATNTNYSVVSSDNNIATVSKNGNSITINGLSDGSATITVTTEDGGYSAQCEVNVQLSQTPTHLALAVKKDDVRYFVASDVYSMVDLSGYTKEGVVIVSSSQSFILALNDASDSGMTHSAASNLGVILPTKGQAELICSCGIWDSLNNKLVVYGGTTMPTGRGYWTETKVSSESSNVVESRLAAIPSLPGNGGGIVVPSSYYAYAFYGYNILGGVIVEKVNSSEKLYVRAIVATL